MGITQDLDKVLGAGEGAKIPDLDWLALDAKDVDNIPVPMNVEIIPQLQQQWGNVKEASTHLIPNNANIPSKAASVVSPEDIHGVVNTAKKQMMLGTCGGELATKLASMYPQDVIQASKDELVKVAAEQGLLGNVYIDMSAFDSCQQAVNLLGQNRVRLAKYAVGTPSGRCCRTHKSGYCTDLRKKVVPEMSYDGDLFTEYSSYLKMAGDLGIEEKIASKEDLRGCMLRRRQRAKKRDQQENKDTKEAADASMDPASMDAAFKAEVARTVEAQKREYAVDKFNEARPVLAFIQDQMLHGNIGNSLKDAISKKFGKETIKKYASEIRRAASLQGLLGNVYIDVSYYKNADEAVAAIKNATTSPAYLVQTRKANKFDSTLEKVASATGCAPLPSDGKIDKKIASSYINDLEFNKRLSPTSASALRKELEASDNSLAVLRTAFLSTLNQKKEVRQGGVPGYEYVGGPSNEHRAAHKEANVKVAVLKALDKGFSIDSIENKLASTMTTTEVVGAINTVLSSLKEVDANCLVKCTTEKYPLSSEAMIKKASKCSNCVYCASSACVHLGRKFAGTENLDKAFFDMEKLAGGEAESNKKPIDPKTQKVLLEQNPDVARDDMSAFEIDDQFGSGMNIALDKMRGGDDKEASVDIEMGLSEGIDEQLSA